MWVVVVFSSQAHNNKEKQKIIVQKQTKNEKKLKLAHAKKTKES